MCYKSVLVVSLFFAYLLLLSMLAYVLCSAFPVPVSCCLLHTGCHFNILVRSDPDTHWYERNKRRCGLVLHMYSLVTRNLRFWRWGFKLVCIEHTERTSSLLFLMHNASSALKHICCQCGCWRSCVMLLLVHAFISPVLSQKCTG